MKRTNEELLRKRGAKDTMTPAEKRRVEARVASRKRHRQNVTVLFIRRMVALGFRPDAANVHTIVGFFMIWEEEAEKRLRVHSFPLDTFNQASRVALDFYIARIVESIRVVDFGNCEPFAKAAWEDAMVSAQLLYVPTVKGRKLAGKKRRSAKGKSDGLLG